MTEILRGYYESEHEHMLRFTHNVYALLRATGYTDEQNTVSECTATYGEMHLLGVDYASVCFIGVTGELRVQTYPRASWQQYPHARYSICYYQVPIAQRFNVHATADTLARMMLCNVYNLHYETGNRFCYEWSPGKL